MYDAAYEQLNLTLPGGTMVDIQEDLKAAAPVEKLSLPAEALALLEAEGLSKEDITRFVREWNALSETKKLEWLTDAGYAAAPSN